MFDAKSPIASSNANPRSLIGRQAVLQRLADAGGSLPLAELHDEHKTPGWCWADYLVDFVNDKEGLPKTVVLRPEGRVALEVLSAPAQDTTPPAPWVSQAPVTPARWTSPGIG